MWYTRNYSELSFLDVPLVFILVNEAMSGVFCLELQTILQFSQLQRRPYYLLLVGSRQGDYDGRGQRTASPMLTAIMSGGVGISGRELSTQLINSLEQANHSFS